MTVTKLLQETWLRLLQPESKSKSYTLTERIEDPELEKAKFQTQSLVDQRRTQFLKREWDKVPRPEKIPIRHVKVLVEAADAFNPECALLVGASIWWELLDNKSFSDVLNSRIPEYVPVGPGGEFIREVFKRSETFLLTRPLTS